MPSGREDIREEGEVCLMLYTMGKLEAIEVGIRDTKKPLT